MQYFLKDNEYIHLSNTVILDGSHYFYETTKPSVCRGSWYYEVTHNSGTSLSVVGFADSDDYQISVSSFSNELSLYAILKDQSKSLGLGSPVQEKYTLGIGLDIDNHMFYLRINSQDVRVITLDDSFHTNIEWNVMLRPRADDKTLNNYTINFGDSDFQYDVPFGFTPWSKNLRAISCKRIKLPTFKGHIFIIVCYNF